MSGKTGVIYLATRSFPKTCRLVKRENTISRNGGALPVLRSLFDGSYRLEGIPMSIVSNYSSAIEQACSMARLDELSRGLWSVLHVAGHVSDEDATSLGNLIKERREHLSRPRKNAVPGRASYFPPKPAPRSYNRAQSRHRKRGMARARWLPDVLAANFTEGELAALSVVAEAVKKKGKCLYPIAKIAALAGVSESTVRNAFRAGRTLGLIYIRERRRPRDRNLPNVVTVISSEWNTWLERRSASWSRGGGCKGFQATILKDKKISYECRESSGRVSPGPILTSPWKRWKG